MSKNNRMKASDVFQETDFFFGKKVPFAEAFPEFKNVSVEVEEIGKGSHYGPIKRWYTEKNLGEYIDCSNTICYNGGFKIGEILREMVKNKQNDLEITRHCQGYEGSPKGRKNYGPCFNYFNIKVHIEYKESKSDTEKNKKNK